MVVKDYLVFQQSNRIFRRVSQILGADSYDLVVILMQKVFWSQLP